MPAIVPHTKDEPFLAMSRFECGPGGNPHHHGVAYGAGNPQAAKDMEEEKPKPVLDELEDS